MPKQDQDDRYYGAVAYAIRTIKEFPNERQEEAAILLRDGSIWVTQNISRRIGSKPAPLKHLARGLFLQRTKPNFGKPFTMVHPPRVSASAASPAPDDWAEIASLR